MGGGFKKPGTFIEYSKSFIDALNAWHSRQPGKFKVSELTRTVASLHFYDSVLVLEKKAMQEPTRERRGSALFSDYEHRSPRLIDRLRQLMG